VLFFSLQWHVFLRLTQRSYHFLGISDTSERTSIGGFNNHNLSIGILCQIRISTTSRSSCCESNACLLHPFIDAGGCPSVHSVFPKQLYTYAFDVFYHFRMKKMKWLFHCVW
jgi:hypothetical protein